jgi:hypothetical protein
MVTSTTDDAHQLFAFYAYVALYDLSSIILFICRSVYCQVGLTQDASWTVTFILLTLVIGLLYDNLDKYKFKVLLSHLLAVKHQIISGTFLFCILG